MTLFDIKCLTSEKQNVHPGETEPFSVESFNAAEQVTEPTRYSKQSLIKLKFNCNTFKKVFCINIYTVNQSSQNSNLKPCWH